MASEPKHRPLDSSLSRSLHEQDTFVPQFCDVQMVLPFILMAQLVVFVQVIVSRGLADFDWEMLGELSFHVQWQLILSAAVLCRLTPWLKRFAPISSGLISYIVLLLIGALVSCARQYLSMHFGQLLDMSGFVLYAEHDLMLMVLEDTLVTALIAGIALRYLYLQGQVARRKQAELNARIDALQARIRPHFLFNTLNSIATLVSIDSQKAEQAIDDLGTLLRTSLQKKQVEVPLADEIELCKRYLAIEKLRLDSRLTVQWQIVDIDVNTILIPSLTLQPLLENAVHYGIEPIEQGGVISIEILVKNADLILQVSNSLPDKSANQSQKRLQGQGMALDNIRTRLKSLYGDSANVEMAVQDNQIFQVTINYALSHTRSHVTAPNAAVQTAIAAQAGTATQASATTRAESS